MLSKDLRGSQQRLGIFVALDSSNNRPMFYLYLGVRVVIEITVRMVHSFCMSLYESPLVKLLFDCLSI